MAQARIVVLDSITTLKPEHVGQVVVAASHGGLYAGACAIRGRVRAVILNDAGVGFEESGILSLAALARIGMAAATVSVWSSRIGLGRDMIENGVISHVNTVAAALGCRVGESAADCARLLLAAPQVEAEAPDIRESRHVIRDEPGLPVVVALDSSSLVGKDDAGRIAIVASHGALIGLDPAQAIKAPVLAAVFHDAGIGKDDAGYSRLPVLDARGIAAATVAHTSARIGDALSIWQTGRISHMNGKAAAAGVLVGDSVPTFVDRITAAWMRAPEG